MEKIIKIVLVFMLILSIVIIWVGIKNRQGGLIGKGKTKVSPGAKGTIVTSEELEKMDLIAEDLAQRKETATGDELEVLEHLTRIIEASKEQGRMLTAEEAAALIVDPLEGEFLEELIPEEPLPPEAVDWSPEAVDLPLAEDSGFLPTGEFQDPLLEYNLESAPEEHLEDNLMPFAP